MIKIKNIFAFMVCLLFLTTCEKEVDIEVPRGEPQLVIEGLIETSGPPLVMVTRNQNFFGNSQFGSVDNMMVHGAVVKITTNGNVYPLSELCSSSLPDSLLTLVAGIIGIDSATLASINICLYTTFDMNAWGVEGRQYDLEVMAEGHTVTGTTLIPYGIALDSVWYKAELPHTDRGFCWARLSDPPALGNSYRWFAMRKNKDYGFLAPMGSAFEDKFINGQSFEFTAIRAHAPDDDMEENAGYRAYFRQGDTIIVKFTTIDHDHYQFWRSYETQVVNNGNPFAAPANVISNVKGGLGVWGGYAVRYDTTVAE